MKILDMEIALASHFNFRVNLIVPNVSWGFGVHECDLFVVSKSGYGWEIEIKTSRADLKRDKFKRHNHDSWRAPTLIKDLWFAIPDTLSNCHDLVPERAGIIHVNNSGGCRKIRRPKPNKKARKLTGAERLKLAELGCMRIWGLKNGLRYKRLKKGDR